MPQALAQKEQGSLLIYYPSQNIVEFTKQGRRIENAIDCLTFSYEVHCDSSNYPNSELNVVVGKDRKVFLSSRVENVSLEKVVKH